ncbi:apoptosis regulator BAX-like [Haliotis asinina]|uniref:apoptosis regulator BAX-like n=1 Tax=Haliotis asinina TaxID=109174 RepID=UPI0035327676
MFHLNRADVVKQTRYQLASYIHSRMEEDGIHNPPSVDQLLDSQYPRYVVSHPFTEVVKTVHRSLDEVRELHRLIERIPHDVEEDTICQVIQGILKDNVINWGRLASIFYFAYKMSVKERYDVVKTRWIIETVVESMQNEVTQWIIDNGGWDQSAAMFAIKQFYPMVKDHLKQCSKQMLFVLGAGGVVCGIVYLWNRMQE